jgi:hypothetical protein
MEMEKATVRSRNRDCHSRYLRNRNINVHIPHLYRLVLVLEPIHPTPHVPSVQSQRLLWYEIESRADDG